jgi:hypothetical protein
MEREMVTRKAAKITKDGRTRDKGRQEKSETERKALELTGEDSRQN